MSEMRVSVGNILLHTNLGENSPQPNLNKSNMVELVPDILISVNVNGPLVQRQRFPLNNDK